MRWAGGEDLQNTRQKKSMEDIILHYNSVFLRASSALPFAHSPFFRKSSSNSEALFSPDTLVSSYVPVRRPKTW